MRREHNYYVYIATNFPRKTVLYTGVTANLTRRFFQHKNKDSEKSFSAKYNVNRIVFCERFSDINDAIVSEKRIKGWTRVKKIDLINKNNPDWDDLIEKYCI